MSTTTTSNANGVDAPRGPRVADEVELIARELESRGRLGVTRSFIQHGDVSVHPHVPIPPPCREAWIVCMADQACALSETVAGRLPGRRADEAEGLRA